MATVKKKTASTKKKAAKKKTAGTSTGKTSAKKSTVTGSPVSKKSGGSATTKKSTISRATLPGIREIRNQISEITTGSSESSIAVEKLSRILCNVIRSFKIFYFLPDLDHSKCSVVSTFNADNGKLSNNSFDFLELNLPSQNGHISIPANLIDNNDSEWAVNENETFYSGTFFSIAFPGLAGGIILLRDNELPEPSKKEMELADVAIDASRLILENFLIQHEKKLFHDRFQRLGKKLKETNKDLESERNLHKTEIQENSNLQNILKSRIEELEEKLKTIAESYTEKLKNQESAAKKDKSEQASKFETRIQDIENQYQTKLTEQKNYYESAIESSEKDFHVQIEKLKEEFESRINKHISENKNLNDSLTADFDSKINSLKADHERELIQLKEEHNSSANDLSRKLDLLQREKEEFISTLSDLRKNIELKDLKISELLGDLDYEKSERASEYELYEEELSDAKVKVSELHNHLLEKDHRLKETEDRLKTTEVAKKEENERNLTEIKKLQNILSEKETLLKESSESIESRISELVEERDLIQSELDSLAEKSNKEIASLKALLDEQVAASDSITRQNQSYSGQIEQISTDLMKERDERREESTLYKSELEKSGNRIHELEGLLEDSGSRLRSALTKIGELNSGIEEVAEAKNRALKDLEATLRDLRDEYDGYRNEHHLKEETLNRDLAALHLRINELEAQKATFQSNLDEQISLHKLELEEEQKAKENLRNEFNEEREKILLSIMEKDEFIESGNAKISELNNHIENKESKISELNSEIETLNQKLIQEKNERDHEQDSWNQTRRELENKIKATADSYEVHIVDLKRDISNGEDRITELKKDLEHRREKVNLLEGTRAALEKDLESVREKIANRENEIKEKNKLIDTLRNDLEALQNGFDEKINELEESSLKIKDLQDTISILKDHEHNLEKNVVDLRNEKELIQREAQETRERLSEFESIINRLNQELNDRNDEIEKSNDREKNLNDELERSRKREQGVREESVIIAGLLESLAKEDNFSGKLRHILKYAPTTKAPLRITVYSLDNEDQLILHDSCSSSGSCLKPEYTLPLPLSSTVYGGSLASGKPVVIEDMPDVDFPPEIEMQSDTENPVSFLVLPLFDTGKASGVAVIGMPESGMIQEREIRIFEQLSPLLAVALKSDQMNINQESARNQIERIRGLIDYLENRYIAIAGAIRELKDTDNFRFEQQNRFTRLFEFTSVMVPTEGTRDRAKNELSHWLDKICRFAAGKSNLEYDIKIDPDALDLLEKRCSRNFSLLYWITMEAIENVILHSQAKKLNIELNSTNREVHYRIVDNGEGLLRTAGTENPSNGRGLEYIRNLVDLMGGNLELGRDERGHGLSVNIQW